MAGQGEDRTIGPVDADRWRGDRRGGLRLPARRVLRVGRHAAAQHRGAEIVDRTRPGRDDRTGRVPFEDPREAPLPRSGQSAVAGRGRRVDLLDLVGIAGWHPSRRDRAHVVEPDEEPIGGEVDRALPRRRTSTATACGSSVSPARCSWRMRSRPITGSDTTSPRPTGTTTTRCGSTRCSIPVRSTWTTPRPRAGIRSSSRPTPTRQMWPTRRSSSPTSTPGTMTRSSVRPPASPSATWPRPGCWASRTT